MLHRADFFAGGVGLADAAREILVACLTRLVRVGEQDGLAILRDGELLVEVQSSEQPPVTMKRPGLLVVT